MGKGGVEWEEGWGGGQGGMGKGRGGVGRGGGGKGRNGEEEGFPLTWVDLLAN